MSVFKKSFLLLKCLELKWPEKNTDGSFSSSALNLVVARLFLDKPCDKRVGCLVFY